MIGYRIRMALGALLLLAGPCAFSLRAQDAGLDDDKWKVPLEVEAEDPDGDKLTFQWTQVSGPKVRIAKASDAKTWFVPTEPGEYVFEIRVSDGKDAVVGTKKVNVAKPNLAPVAIPRVQPERATMNQRVVFDASLSKDPDGKLKAYQWKQTGGPAVKLTEQQLQARQFDFDAAEPGEYAFELKVSDGETWSEPATVELKVAAVNKKPRINIAGSEEEKHNLPVTAPVVTPEKPSADAPPVVKVEPGKPVKLGEELVLDGRGSHDPLGQELEYFWSQKLDGKVPLLRSLKHDPKFAKDGRTDPLATPVWRVKPEQPGVYRFQLEVTAGKGAKQRRASSDVIEFEVVEGEQDRAPVADLFIATPAVEKGVAVELDGSKSKDPEGKELSYIWGWSGEGLKPRKWIGRDGPKVKFETEEEGEYGIKLIVSDGKHQSEPALGKVIVRGANHAPTVNLPESVPAIAGQAVRLEAIVEDADGDPTTVQWTVVEPAELKLPPETLTQNPLVFTPTEKRVYLVQLVAHDGTASSPARRVQVQVGDDINLAPTAVIAGAEAAAVGQEVTLSAERSSDPEHKRLTFHWKQLSGPAIAGPAPGLNDKTWTFTPGEAGEIKIELVVSDGANESPAHVWKLNVGKGNRAPVAKVAEPPAIFAGEEIAVDGSASHDEDEGDKLTYRWRVLDAVPKVELVGRDQPQVTVKTAEPGTVRLELLVNDGQADGAPAMVQLKIQHRNKEPIAHPEGPETAHVGETVTLTAEKSRDAEGGKLTAYQWSQVEGAGPEVKLSEREKSLPKLVFRPEAEGAYVFQLLVTDEGGMRSKPATWTVNVSAPVNPPLASAKAEGESPFPLGRAVTLSAAESKDPNGKPLVYTWKQVDGPARADVKADGPSLTVNAREAGAYVFEVVVDNGKVKSAPARVSFEVNADNAPPVAEIAEIVPVEAGDKLALDGTPSKDPEGKALEYRWRAVTWPDGGEPDLGWLAYKRDALKVKLPKPGEYEFELKVYDGKHWSEPKVVKVATRQANVPPQAAPVALAGFTPADLAGTEDLLKLPHVIKTRRLITEERREVILDGSGSDDPDKGPEKLKYTWRQVAGARPENLKQEGARVSFVAPRRGDMIWELSVSDGKAESQPEQVKLTIVEPGSLPRAIATPNLIRAKAAPRGTKDPSHAVILDGRASKGAPGRELKFAWKQVGGEDLQLSPLALSKPRIGINIYIPGKYRFMLTVFDGDFTSLPAIVDVLVNDGSMAETDAPQTPEGTEKVEAREPENKKPVEPLKVAPKPVEVKNDEDGAWIPPPRDVRETATAKPVKPKEPAKPEPMAVAPLPREVPDEEPAVAQPRPKPEPVKPEPVEAKPVERPLPAPEPAVTAQPHSEPKPVAPVAPAALEPEPVKPVAAVTRSKMPWDDPSYRVEDPVFQNQKRKLFALAIESGAEAEKLLIAGLDDRDADLRSVAAMGLVQRGLGSVPGLLSVLENGSAASKTEAHRALKELAKKDVGTDVKAWRGWWFEMLGLAGE